MKGVNTTLIKITLILLSLIAFDNNLYSQNSIDSVCVNVEKPGKLKKALKDTDLLKLKVLKVTGVLNQKDLNFLGKKKLNISILDFSAASFTSSSKYEYVEIPNIPTVREYYDFYAWEIKGEVKNIYHEIPFESLKILGKSYGSSVRGHFNPSEIVIYPSKISAEHDQTENSYTDMTTFITSESFRGMSIYKPSNINLDCINYIVNFNFNLERNTLDKTADLLSNKIYKNSKIIKFVSNNESYLIVNKWESKFPKKLLKDIVWIRKEAFKDINYIKSFNNLKIRVINERAFFNCLGLEKVYTPNVILINESAFCNCSRLKEINISEVRTIGDNAFKNCSRLENVDLPLVVSIGGSAFEGCKSISKLELHELDYLGPRFAYNTNISYLKIPYVRNLNSYFYKGIDKVEFTDDYVNKKSVFDCDIKSYNTMFIIPKGSWNFFNKNHLRLLPSQEKDNPCCLNLEIKEPGTLNKILTKEKFDRVSELTIKGILYDTDIDYISDCPNLIKIDISNCVVLNSPGTIESKRLEQEYMLGMFTTVMGMAADQELEKMKYGNGNGAVYAQTKSLSDIFEELSKDSKKNTKRLIKKCITPDFNSEMIREIHYPKYIEDFYLAWHLTYGDDRLKNLRVVEFPKYAKSIYFDRRCSKIEKVIYPNDIEYITIDSGYKKFWPQDIQHKLKEIYKRQW